MTDTTSGTITLTTNDERDVYLADVLDSGLLTLDWVEAQVPQFGHDTETVTRTPAVVALLILLAAKDDPETDRHQAAMASAPWLVTGSILGDPLAKVLSKAVGMDGIRRLAMETDEVPESVKAELSGMPDLLDELEGMVRRAGEKARQRRVAAQN